MNRLGLLCGRGFSAEVGAGRLDDMIDESALRRQYALLRPSLDERGRRLRWSPFPGQFRGWDKLGSGPCHAANLIRSDVPW